MLLKGDPFANPEPLIRRVYAYVAYRVGEGPDAEDITSETFERALRYRSSFDSRRGDAAAWLIGIARRCIADAPLARAASLDDIAESAAPGDVEGDAVRRVELAAALSTLDERERELLALRYGGDLTARQIGELLEMKTNAVEVALHRALRTLRNVLAEPEGHRDEDEWRSAGHAV
ncbi:MAG: RNA polymerase sigma factor [Gaiellaceae bacterium]